MNDRRKNLKHFNDPGHGNSRLREKTEDVPYVPDEHMDAVERGIEQADAGLSQPMTADDWSRLRERARNVAATARTSNP